MSKIRQKKTKSSHRLTKASFSQLIIIVLGAVLNFLFIKNVFATLTFSFTILLYILFKLTKDNRAFIRNEIGDYKGKWRDLIWLTIPSLFYFSLFTAEFHILFLFLSMLASFLLMMRSVLIFRNSKQRYATVHNGENNHLRAILEHTSGFIDDDDVVKLLISRKISHQQTSNIRYVFIYLSFFALFRIFFIFVIILKSDTLFYSLIRSLVEYLIFRGINITSRSMNKKKNLYDDMYDSYGAKKGRLFLLMSYPIIFIFSNTFILILLRNIHFLDCLFNGTSWSEIGYINANTFQIILFVFIQIPLNIIYILLIINNHVISYRLLIIKYGLKTQPKKNKHQQVALVCNAYILFQMGWWWANLSNLFLFRDLITIITLIFSIVYLILIRKTGHHQKRTSFRFILSIIIQNGMILLLIWIIFPYISYLIPEIYVVTQYLLGLGILINYMMVFMFFLSRKVSLEKEKDLKFKETFPGSLVYLAESKIFRKDNSKCYKLVTLALEYKDTHEMILPSNQEADIIYYVAKYANLLENNTEYEIHKKKLKSLGKFGEERIKHLEKGREWLLKDYFLSITIFIIIMVIAIMVLLWLL